MFKPFTPSETTHRLNGVQYRFYFSNNRGASVIRHPGSYGFALGLWELAVILKEGEGWHLDYSTPITEDVLGHLTEAEVIGLLAQIQALPAEGPTLTGTHQKTFTAYGFTFTIEGGFVFSHDGEIVGDATDNLDEIASEYALIHG